MSYINNYNTSTAAEIEGIKSIMDAYCTDIHNSIKTILDDASSVVYTKMNIIQNDLSTYIQSAQATLDSLYKDADTSLISYINRKDAGLLDTINTNVSALKDDSSTKYNALNTSINSVVTRFNTSINNVLTDVYNSMNTIDTSIRSDLNNKINNSSLHIHSIIGDISSRISSTSTNVIDKLNASINYANSLVESKINDLSTRLVNTSTKIYSELSTYIGNVNTSVNLINTSINTKFNTEHDYFQGLIDNVSEGIIADYKSADTALRNLLEPKIQTNAEDISTLNNNLKLAEERIVINYNALCSSTYSNVLDIISNTSTKILGELNTSINNINSSINSVISAINSSISDISTKIIEALNASINTKYEELVAKDSSILSIIYNVSTSIPKPQTLISATEDSSTYVYSEGTLDSNKTIVSIADTSIIHKNSQLQLTYGIWNGGQESIKYVTIPVATDTADGLLSYSSKIKYDNYDNHITISDISIHNILRDISTEIDTRSKQIENLQDAIDNINDNTISDAISNLESRLDGVYENRFQQLEGKFNNTISNVSTLLSMIDSSTATSFMAMDASLNSSINTVYETLITLINNVSDGIINDYKIADSLLENRIKTIEDTTIDTAINDLSTAIHKSYDTSINEIFKIQDASYTYINDSVLPLLKQEIKTDLESLIRTEENGRKETDSLLKTDILVLQNHIDNVSSNVMSVVVQNMSTFIQDTYLPKIAQLEAAIVDINKKLTALGDFDAGFDLNINNINDKIKQIEEDITVIKNDLITDYTTVDLNNVDEITKHYSK